MRCRMFQDLITELHNLATKLTFRKKSKVYIIFLKNGRESSLQLEYFGLFYFLLQIWNTFLTQLIFFSQMF